MDTKFSLNRTFVIVTSLLILIGIVAFGYGLAVNPQQSWSNLLLNNYYFISIAIGASFFLALQYITQSGWSALFKRVPEAMGYYVPVAGILMLVMYFGMSHLFEWAHHDTSVTDELIAHKSPYLNLPFFFIRILIYFGIWTYMIRLLRKLSLKEDQEGGILYFEKSEFFSKVFIFILALTFSLASFDWVMSLDVHWFSTIFSFKLFASGFYHGAAMLVLIVILLHERGFYKELNGSHLLDFSRYLFMLSIVWGYLFFSQFMLIWFGNIPEETFYYARIWGGSWKVIFFINILINWFFPFLLLMWRKADRNITVVKWTAVLILVGHWIDLYIQIFPATVKDAKFGFIEIGTFLGFLGLFGLVTAYGLTKAAVVPKNHPYLEESLHHEVE